MGKFLKFDRMMTPIIIKTIFWLGVLFSIIAGLFMIGYGILSSNAGFPQMIIGVIILFLGPFVIRINCEMLIVFFKMQESLVDIRELLAKEGKIEPVRIEDEQLLG